MNSSKFFSKSNKIYFFIVGFGTLIWFLIRVIPKPQRAAYPCQRAAFPLASGFIIWLSVHLFSFLGIKKLASLYKNNDKTVKILFLAVFVTFTTIWLVSFPFGKSIASSHVDSNELFVPTDSANTPIGTARGIFPGRVVWAFDTTFTKWTGSKGFWWDSAYTDQATVSDMFSRSLNNISGAENDSLAWDIIFKFFNQKHGKGELAYKKGEKIAIKLSLVQSTNPSSSGENSNFTTPQLALALLRSLVNQAGVDAADIYFYDIMRSIPTSISLRCKKEFPGVHFVGSKTGQYQEKYSRDTTIIHWSEKLDMEIKGGNTAYLPTVVTKASYIINLANMKGHRYVGITGCSKNHFGSLSANGDSNTPHAIGLHCYIAVHDYLIPASAEWSFKGREMGTYNPLVDLMGHKDLGDKTLLFIIDGLLSVPRENDPNSVAIKWKQYPFNNHFSSSLFVSQDNVAIESVVLDFFREEQAINSSIKQTFDDGTGTHAVIFGNIDNYLHEAALADSPVSGTKYTPNGDGKQLSSLGVHEHWNNVFDKQYSRNLGKNEGIELVEITPTISAPKNLEVSTSLENISKLNWANDTTNGIIEIYKSITTKTNYKKIAVVDGNATEFEDVNNFSPCYYKLKRIDSTKYSPFSNEVKTLTTSVPNAIADNLLQVYPVPAKDFIYIDFKLKTNKKLELSVCDFAGRILISKILQKNKEKINISELKNGFYSLNFKVGNATFNRNIIIQN